MIWGLGGGSEEFLFPRDVVRALRSSIKRIDLAVACMRKNSDRMVFILGNLLSMGQVCLTAGPSERLILIQRLHESQVGYTVSFGTNT